MEQSKEQVIFLDVDGVFTTVRGGWFNWDPIAITFILWICEQTGCKVVISSTWRFYKKKTWWKSIFGKHLHKDWHTPDFQQGSSIHRIYRGYEVKDWLEKHPNVGENWIAIDDNKDFLDDQMNHLVLTDGINGMLWHHMRDILIHFEISTDAWQPDDMKLFRHKNITSEYAKPTRKLSGYVKVNFL